MTEMDSQCLCWRKRLTRACYWPQELDFEQKVSKLRAAFPQVDDNQVTHCLETAQGSVDAAYGMLLEDVEDLKQQVCLIGTCSTSNFVPRDLSL